MPDAQRSIAIAGAGCSGLSTAVELARALPHDVQIVLFDPRPELVHDHTWSSWNVAPHAFGAAVSHRWPRWSVRHDGRTIVRESRGLEYQHVPADRFYEVALKELRASPRVELRLGERVTAVDEADGCARLRTRTGELRARLVLDSRPPVLGQVPRGEVRLLQHFRGWHVASPDARFDPTTALLMDFDVDQRHGIAFVYVLPFGEHEALVEATWFSRTTLDDATYDAALRNYLAERHGLERYDRLRVERGVIPMTTERFEPRPSPHVYRMGVAGGCAKPSTGYAFVAIQRFARAFAARAAHETLPRPPRIRSRRANFLDRVFLTFLSRRPERAPALLAGLFERAPPDVLVRFLSDTSSVADDLAVVRVMPSAPMIEASLIRASGRA